MHRGGWMGLGGRKIEGRSEASSVVGLKRVGECRQVNYWQGWDAILNDLLFRWVLCC